MDLNATQHKRFLHRILRLGALTMVASIIGAASLKAQTGRVFINEYLPWPNNGCATTTEFIELMNFGPGPMNIGCYIVTDGDYSITIPPNTILQPGQYYVLSGQDVLPMGCGNLDSAVHVSLNWETCGCTSAPIPTTGDGLMTDGGTSSEQVVLLDPNLNVVDAVVRQTPEPSSKITTATVSGGCTSKTYDLDSMNVQYETIGQSDGRGNSMARQTDGGCIWLKQTQQSANATNNTTSSNPNLDGAVVTNDLQTCMANGTATVYIYTTPYNTIFPVNYILAKDVNNNGIYDSGDTYADGTAAGNPNSFTLSGLGPGNYEIMVDTKNGCGMTLFDFTLTCSGTLLDATFAYFKASLSKDQTAWLLWDAANREEAAYFDIEKSTDGIRYTRIGTVQANNPAYSNGYYFTDMNLSPANYYRIKMMSTGGKAYYSGIQLITLDGKGGRGFRAYPNPFRDHFTLEMTADYGGLNQLQVIDMYGRTLKTVAVQLQAGENIVTINTGSLPAGMYYVQLKDNTQAGGRIAKMVKTL